MRFNFIILQNTTERGVIIGYESIQSGTPHGWLNARPGMRAAIYRAQYDSPLRKRRTANRCSCSNGSPIWMRRQTYPPAD